MKKKEDDPFINDLYKRQLEVPAFYGDNISVLGNGAYFIVSEDPAVKNFLFIDMNKFFKLHNTRAVDIVDENGALIIFFLSSATYPIKQLELVKESYMNLYGEFPLIKMSPEKERLDLVFSSGCCREGMISVEKKALMVGQEDVKKIQFAWQGISKVLEKTPGEEEKKHYDKNRGNDGGRSM